METEIIDIKVPLVIGIPVHNNVGYTEKVIASLIEHSKTSKYVQKYHVYVIDNGSTDSTPTFLQKLIDSTPLDNIEFHIIVNDENKGYGIALNQALEHAYQNIGDEFDFIALNNDIELFDGCIDNIIQAVYSDIKIGIAGAKLLFPDGTIQHAGAFLNAFGWGQHLGGGQHESHYLDSEGVRECEFVTGALFYMRRSLLEELRGDECWIFDEQFSPAYFEEVDVCYRAWEYGFKVVYVPTARAIHYENATGKILHNNDTSEIKKQLSNTNQVKFYKKFDDEILAPAYEYGNKLSVIGISPPKLLMTCKIYGDWSFSHVMRNLAKGLDRSGVDVSIAPVEYHYDVQSMPDWEIKRMINKPNDYWNRYVLRSSEGDHMYLMPPGIKRISHTTGESTLVRPEWIRQLEQTDLTVTTSNFFKDVLIRSGMKEDRVKVIPNTVDVTRFNKDVKPLKIAGLRDFNFVSVFHFGERKAPDVLIKAFVEAFEPTDNVTLTLHALGIEHFLRSKGLNNPGEWISELIEYKDHAPIYVTPSRLSSTIMPRFLKTFDVNVLTSRGEGFGLPLLEAGAVGVPSIATNHSGILDIVYENNGWLIDRELIDIPLQELPYFKNYLYGKWADPSVEHTAELMKYTYNHRDEVKIKGQRSYEHAQNFSIENIGKLAREIIFDGI